MDFEALPAWLGLDEEAWSVLLGFFSFGEEPADRVAHLCRVPDDVVARAVPVLVAKGYVRRRVVDGVQRVGLAPLDGWLPATAPAGDADRWELEAGRLRRLVEYRGLPGIVVISSRELRDRSRLVPALARHFAEMFPNVDLRLGTRCNLNCTYCLLGHEDRYLRPLDEIVAELAFARKQNVEKVALTGGEPTLHPDLGKVIAAARALGFRMVMLITNGVTLSVPGRLDKLVKAGVSLVGISFDTADRDTAESMWQSPVFDRVVDGLRAAVAHPDLTTRSIAVVTGRNAAQMPDLARFFVDVAKGAKRDFMPNLDFVMPEENAWVNRAELVPRMTDVIAPVREALEYAHAHGLHMTFRGFPFCLLPGLDRYCMDLYMSIFQLVETPAGVVFDRTAIDVLRAKAPGCRRCRFNRECLGVSRSYASLYGLGELQPIEGGP